MRRATAVAIATAVLLGLGVGASAAVITGRRPPPSEPEPPATAFMAAEPVSVAIPAIGVRSELVDLGTQPDGRMEVPTDFDLAGWYVHGSKLGEPGPLVVAGHIDSRSGPAVFYRLAALYPGARIEMTGADGTVHTYTVDRVEQHPKDAFPTFAVFGATEQHELRLVTCGGRFDSSARSYDDNVVVFAAPT